MQKSQIYALICAILLLGAITIDHASERVDLGHAVPRAIEQFPRTLGPWHAVKDVPMPDSLQDALPTARAIERVYSGPDGASVDMLLLTATDYGDIHNPNACFPAQGWKLSQGVPRPFNGQTLYTMQATLDDNDLDVLYWFPNDYRLSPPRGRVARLVYDFYAHKGSKKLGESVMARVIVQNNPEARAVALRFAAAMMPALSALPPQKTAA